MTLRRGTTYKGQLVGAPGPALLGLGSIVAGGGFRDDYKTYGGECPPELTLTPGDLYVSLKGATKDGSMVGSVARVPEAVPRGRLTQDTVRLIFQTHDKGFQHYLYWLLRTPDYRAYCAGRVTGSAVAALSRDDFLSYSVPPLTAVRRRIVDVLENIEDKLESNRRSVDLIQDLSRSMFAAWRFAAPTVSQTTFGEFAEVFGGATPKTSQPEYWEGGIAWATPTDMTALTAPYLFGTSRTITETGLAATSAMLHPSGTIFMTSRATIGVFAVNQIPAATNQGFIAVRPHQPEHRWFLFEEMRGRVPEMLGRANGSTFLELSRGNFKLMPLDVPTAEALAVLDTQLAPLHAHAAQLVHESSALASLRTVLLPELLLGRVRNPPTLQIAESVA